MIRLSRDRALGNERGATIVVVAISLVFIMGSAAIAIDLGMLQSARAEAQRAADAAALAGASEYLDPLPTETGAEARARDFASRNFVMGQAGDAGVLEVDVDHAAQRVTVRIQHEHGTWFARILGINSANVGAIAAARVIQSGTAGCIRPFGIPQGTYTDDDIGTRVLLWESRSQQGNQNEDNVEGNDAFLIVGNPASNPGLGYSVYDMLTDVDCALDQAQIGDEVPAKPGNNQLGSVRRGLKDLEDAYGRLTWSEDGPYNGFNKPDWESDPRVSLIPMYDPATYTGPGADNVTITGFLRVAIVDRLVDCWDNRDPRCAFSGNGKRSQLYAVILPSTGLSDGCVGGNCSEINRVLQLVR